MTDPNRCTLTWCSSLRRCSASDYGNVEGFWYLRLCADVCKKMAVSIPVLDVDKGSFGSKQKFCIHSIFSMSAGVGRGSLKCEDDRSLLSQRL